jgi:hypothetical protein
LERLADHLWMLVPALLVVYLGFDSGGFFAGTTGAAAAGLAGLAAVRILTAPRSQLGPTPVGWLALIGIASYAGLSLLSQHWSHAPARALLAFDLAVLYLALTILCGGLRLSPSMLRTMVYGLIAALGVVCAAAFVTRALPQTFPILPALQTPRVSYPLTYWNAVGMAASLGALLALHAAGDRDSHPVVRVLAGGMIPLFAAVLLLSVSRGAILAVAVGLVIYVLVGMRLTLLTTGLAIGPFMAIAARVTYNATALVSQHPTSLEAVREGRHVGGAVGLCMAGACLAGGAMVFGQRRLPTIRFTRSHVLATALVAGVAIVALAFALNAPRWVHREYRLFINAPANYSTALGRSHLVSASNDGRLPLWQAAVHGFDEQPLHGLGAGTYALLWQRERKLYEPILEAHSLYLQTLAELGILGAVALGMFLVGLLAGACWLLRATGDRFLAALALAVLVAAAVHSAFEWDWQLPAVMAPVVAVVAGAGACARGAGLRTGPPRAVRWLCAASCLGLGVAPALVAISQADLDAAVHAFDRNDCATALRRAGEAHRIVGSRPEPLELIGYCQTRSGAPRRAMTTMHEAIKRDPGDWEFRYALAIATAATGHNPVPILRQAAHLDPHELLLASALTAFRGTTRAQRKRTALTLPLDIPEE